MDAGLIFARTDSSRLPGKVLKRLGDKPLIQWCIDGIGGVKGLEPILVTTDRPEDDDLVRAAVQNGIDYYRGSLENVAQRTRDCLLHFGIKNFARINADCPFMNRALLSEGLEIMKSGAYDMVTNLIPRAFPYGLSIEILSSDIFIENYPSLTGKYQEHITTWFYENIEKFKVYQMKYPFGNDHDIRVVVDTPTDMTNLERFLAEHPELDIPNCSLDTFAESIQSLKN